MPHRFPRASLIGLLALALLLPGVRAAGASAALRWTALPPLPDREGFAFPFAGVDQGALLVAGGANFPDKRPWEGGAKLWYDTVYVLEKPDGAWQTAGRLPRPARLRSGSPLTARSRGRKSPPQAGSMSTGSSPLAPSRLEQRRSIISNSNPKAEPGEK